MGVCGAFLTVRMRRKVARGPSYFPYTARQPLSRQFLGALGPTAPRNHLGFAWRCPPEQGEGPRAKCPWGIATRSICDGRVKSEVEWAGPESLPTQTYDFSPVTDGETFESIPSSRLCNVFLENSRFNGEISGDILARKKSRSG